METEAAKLRLRCRQGALNGPTAGLASGYVQANLVVLPASVADDFEAFCAQNPKPCPLLERLAPGDPHPRQVAVAADIRSDLPRYLIHDVHGSKREVFDIQDHFFADSVAFLLGCSFSFEQALTRAGLCPRNVEEGVNVPMYRTNRRTNQVGPFGGLQVVSMRPIPATRVNDAYEITRRFTHAHGAPIYHGDPAAIGVDDLSRPDWGDAVTVRDGEVPVFWACGVTSQEALTDVLQRGIVREVVTHAPGHMFVTDLRDD